MGAPFVGPSYNLASRPASVQRTINLVPVPVEPGNERTAWVFADVPGLVEFATEFPLSEGIYVFSEPGTYTWNMPEGTVSVEAAVLGAGGGKLFIAQGPGALGEDTLADGGVLAVDHEDRLLKRRRGDAGALVGAGDVAGKRDADDLVAGIDGLLEEVLEHHGRDLARAGQLVGFYEALEELLARKVDALGVLFGAECDGHGDDGNVVGAGVALFHVRRRVHDDANGHNASRVNCFLAYFIVRTRGFVEARKRQVNCS